MIVFKASDMSSHQITEKINTELDSIKNKIQGIILRVGYKVPYHPDEKKILQGEKEVIYFSPTEEVDEEYITVECIYASHYTIALDGPSGSGKSTIAKIIANVLGISYLDTGAMYRAIAYHLDEQGIDREDIQNIKDSLKTIQMSYHNDKLYVNSKAVGEEIRTSRIAKKASFIAQYDFVREFLVERQREIAKKTSCILDGRDIGTVVLPESPYKIYLTANPEVRAKRRFDDLKITENISFDEVLEAIIKRDHADMNRKVSPLKVPKDAVVIDTSDLEIKEVTNRILMILRNK